jgi:hypothetical protein
MLGGRVWGVSGTRSPLPSNEAPRISNSESSRPCDSVSDTVEPFEEPLRTDLGRG